MNNKLAILVVLSVCVGVHGEAGGQKPLPIELSIGAVGGISFSHVVSDSLMESFFEPTSNVEPINAAVFGAHFGARLNRFLGFSVGLQYEKKGQKTTPTKVTFADDIFEHDFESMTILNYVAVPVVVRGGYGEDRFWAFVRGGIVPSRLAGHDFVWVIDDREVGKGSNRMPSVQASWYDVSLLGGLEVGIRFARSGIFVCGDYEHGLKRIAEGLSGGAYNRSFLTYAGYRFFF